MYCENAVKKKGYHTLSTGPSNTIHYLFNYLKFLTQFLIIKGSIPSDQLLVSGLKLPYKC